MDEPITNLLATAEEAVAADQPLSLLLLARRPRGLASSQVNIADDVAAYLRAAASATVEDFLDRDVIPYQADMDLAPEEALSFSSSEGIGEAPIFTELFPQSPPDLENARQLQLWRLAAYAVIAGDGNAQVAFVRKANPGRLARPGRLMTTVGQTLSRIDAPVLAFDDRFDLIVTPTAVVSSSQPVFEDFFRYAPELLEHVPAWVEEIAANLPLAGDGAQILAEKCHSDSRLRRRLRAIVDRGHLAQVTTEHLVAHISALGLRVEDFVADDELLVDAQNPYTLMYLLNEDLFVGGLTQDRFRSDRKSPT